MRRTFGACALLSLSLAAPGSAQAPARLEGSVTDAVTGRPIPAAEVTAGDEHRLAREDGSFLFGSTAPGRFMVRVRAPGYAGLLRAVEVLPGLTVRLDLVLRPVAVQLDPVTVTAEPETGETIPGRLLERRAADLAEALNGWGGIMIRRGGAGDEAVAQVRGSAPDEVLVLLDGFPVNNPLTGRADLRGISTRDIERVTLYRGGQTARYGSRATAAVIVISTKAALRPELGGSVSSRGGVRGRLAIAAEGVSLALMGEHTPDGFSYAAPRGGEAERVNAGGEFYTLNARGRLAGDLVLRGRWSDRGLPGTTVNPSPSARARDRSVLAGFRMGHRWFLSASAEWLTTRAQDDAPPPGFVAYNSHTSGLGGTIAVGRRVPVSGSGWQGEAEAVVRGRADRFEGDAVRAGASFSQAGLSLQGRFSRRPGAIAVTLLPALRLDWWTRRTSPAVSARLDAVLAHRNTTLQAGVGSAVTVPVLADLLFREGAGVRLNPDLQPERVRLELELGVKQRATLLTVPVELNLRGYRGRVDDMVLWSPDFRFVWSPRNFDVRRMGLEGGLNLQPGWGMHFDLDAGWNRITYAQPGGPQVRYRPRFTAAAAAGWARRAWAFDVRWQHVGPRFPNSAGTNPLPAFDLVSSGVEWSHDWIRLRADVRDLGNARPTYIAGYPTPGRSVSLSITLNTP